MSLRRREQLIAYLCVLPWIVGFLALEGGPILASLLMSFTDYPILGSPTFIGFNNYKTLLNDELVWHSLGVTLRYAALTVPLRVVGGYLLALLLNQKVRGLSFWRMAFYLPSIVPVVATSYLFAWLLERDLGLVNYLLSFLGIQGPGWFMSPQWVIPAFVIMSVWSLGWNMVLFLSALQGVPTVLYEAAKVDGANAWHRFYKVTIPLTSPMILFTFLTEMIGMFQTFTSSYVTTAGGPANASLFYVLYLYRNAWQYFRMGYAATLSWLLTVILFVLTALMWRFSSRLVYYEFEGSPGEHP